MGVRLGLPLRLDARGPPQRRPGMAARGGARVIAEAFKLSVYFGDSVAVGPELASDALMERMAAHDVPVAALFRGIEGFGINRRIHTGHFPDISTDLPLLGMAVDERHRIEALLPEVDRAVPR